MSTQQPVPEGYLRDARGRLVPLALVRPIDQERDRLVRDLVAEAKDLSRKIAALKAKMFADIGAFVDLSAEQYKVQLGGKKGNMTLLNFDGSQKVQIATADSLAFDERLEAAKSLIDECASDWAEGARDEVRVVIQEAFRADKEGNLSVGRILALRRWDIKDERWQRAMTAIGEALQVVGSKQYVRLYERVGDSDRYVAIPLDMVSV